ncbi:MAG: YigZ family protein [Clostridia bacterium]|nr:YigZ family protein [Clostridia bacterium]
MDGILTVLGRTDSEKIIEKSRFLTYSAHIESEEEARAFIADVRAQHPFATHVCFAFIADKTGNMQRFSDDGEPQGTAGVPILEVIKNKGLREVVVAVVRYFGGIKLGAGGLVRAYSSCAAENLASAETALLEMSVEVEISVDYTGIDALQKYLSTRTCIPISCDYGAKVTTTVAIKSADKEDFSASLTDYMQGRVEFSFKEECYRAFPV